MSKSELTIERDLYINFLIRKFLYDPTINSYNLKDYYHLLSSPNNHIKSNAPSSLPTLTSHAKTFQNIIDYCIKSNTNKNPALTEYTSPFKNYKQEVFYMQLFNLLQISPKIKLEEHLFNKLLFPLFIAIIATNANPNNWSTFKSNVLDKAKQISEYMNKVEISKGSKPQSIPLTSIYEYLLEFYLSNDFELFIDSLDDIQSEKNIADINKFNVNLLKNYSFPYPIYSISGRAKLFRLAYTELNEYKSLSFTLINSNGAYLPNVINVNAIITKLNELCSKIYEEEDLLYKDKLENKEDSLTLDNVIFQIRRLNSRCASTC